MWHLERCKIILKNCYLFFDYKFSHNLWKKFNQFCANVGIVPGKQIQFEILYSNRQMELQFSLNSLTY